jgi:PAS domain-containing protein
MRPSHRPDGRSLTDGADGLIIKVNSTFYRWMGQTPEALLGKRVRDLLNVAGIW